jgi:hypothetical protein
MTEDDDGVGFDLTAWEAPPPPAGIADAVIARVTAPLATTALEADAPRSKKWWIAGGLAATLVAAVGIALAVRSTTEESTTGSGAVAVARPSHLELGGTAIDLEANTDVWWVREGKRVVAMQPRGSATYRVAGNEQLVIDAGATVASVSASGASLRVEVEMNLSDARLIGTSAVTAAAVALVTVIVYEGHVKVTSADRTVEVAAGSTVQITPNQPPVEPALVSGVEKRLRSEIEFLKLENDLLKKKVAGTIPPTKPSDKMVQFRDSMFAVLPALKACGREGGMAILKIELDSGRVVKRTWKPGSTTPDLDQRVVACLEKEIGKAVFSATLTDSFSFPVQLDGTVAIAPRPDPTPSAGGDLVQQATCSDPAAIQKLEERGETMISSGQFAAALRAFESVLQCKPSGGARMKAYLAACRARNFPRAKVHFKVIGKENWAQICMKEGFDPR